MISSMEDLQRELAIRNAQNPPPKPEGFWEHLGFAVCNVFGFLLCVILALICLVGWYSNDAINFGRRKYAERNRQRSSI